jgi:hypothetical protein
VGRAVVGAGLALTALAVLSVAVGTLLRHPAAVAAMIAVLFVLPGIAQALPDSWRNPVTEFWPTQAGSQLTSVHRRPARSTTRGPSGCGASRPNWRTPGWSPRRQGLDKGYQWSTYAKIPHKGKNKPNSQKQASKAHAKLRAPSERANAQLKSWVRIRS